MSVRKPNKLDGDKTALRMEPEKLPSVNYAGLQGCLKVAVMANSQSNNSLGSSYSIKSDTPIKSSKALSSSPGGLSNSLKVKSSAVSSVESVRRNKTIGPTSIAGTEKVTKIPNSLMESSDDLFVKSQPLRVKSGKSGTKSAGPTRKVEDIEGEFMRVESLTPGSELSSGLNSLSLKKESLSRRLQPVQGITSQLEPFSTPPVLGSSPGILGASMLGSVQKSLSFDTETTMGSPIFVNPNADLHRRRRTRSGNPVISDADSSANPAYDSLNIEPERVSSISPSKKINSAGKNRSTASENNSPSPFKVVSESDTDKSVDVPLEPTGSDSAVRELKIDQIIRDKFQAGMAWNRRFMEISEKNSGVDPSSQGVCGGAVMFKFPLWNKIKSGIDNSEGFKQDNGSSTPTHGWKAGLNSSSASKVASKLRGLTSDINVTSSTAGNILILPDNKPSQKDSMSDTFIPVQETATVGCLALALRSRVENAVSASPDERPSERPSEAAKTDGSDRPPDGEEYEYVEDFNDDPLKSVHDDEYEYERMRDSEADDKFAGAELYQYEIIADSNALHGGESSIYSIEEEEELRQALSEGDRIDTSNEAQYLKESNMVERPASVLSELSQNFDEYEVSQVRGKVGEKIDKPEVIDEGGTFVISKFASDSSRAAPVSITEALGNANANNTANITTKTASGPITWRKGKQIGEGSFGIVFQSLNVATGEMLAVKQLGLSDGCLDEIEMLQKEIDVMWDLDHVNIVRYIGTSRTSQHLYILLEYVTGGSILSLLKEFGPMNEALIRKLTMHMIRGVEYLHQRGIIHRDIKGANVLVTDNGTAKLSDFGCSKRLSGMCTQSMEESLKMIKGSVPWMAPEVIKQSGHGRSSDIWSLGATLIEMATAKLPWPNFRNDLGALFMIATATSPPPIPSSLSPDCSDFIRKCMNLDPKLRPTASDLIKCHQFLQ